MTFPDFFLFVIIANYYYFVLHLVYDNYFPLINGENILAS